MNLWHISIFLLIAFFLYACDTQKNTHIQKIETIGSNALSLHKKSCTYSVHDYVKFMCFKAERLDGVHHSYPVTILRPLKSIESHNSTAVISIPGGPGQGGHTREDWVQSWADWMALSDLDYDLVLYEPPGTLGSSAYFECAQYFDQAVNVAGLPLTHKEEIEFLSPSAERCLKDYHVYLKESGFSMSGVGGLTSQRAKDELGELLSALPHKNIHLLGTSYGTRVALMAADHAKVRTTLLDSPYPFHRGRLTEWPELLGNAFTLHEQYFEGYSEVDGKQYIDTFRDAYQFLKTTPQRWTLSHWNGHSDIEFVLTHDRLLALHFSILYSADMLPHFYAGIQHISDQNDEMRWALEFFITTVYDEQFSEAAYWVIECNDNKEDDRLSFFNAASESDDQFTNWQAFYADNVCAYLPVAANKYVQDLSYHDKPTMILSGALDPVTPTKTAEELNSVLKYSELYVRDNVGHAVLVDEQCLLERIKLFWKNEGVSLMQPKSTQYSRIHARFIEKCKGKR